MRAKTPAIIAVLSLTLLMAMPAPIIKVNAVTGSNPTSWSPFGPWNDNLLITVYSDFQTMFNAFTSGQVDITDWPVQPSDLGPLCNNPDFFCTSKQQGFGITDLEINHHTPFLGKPMFTPRVTGFAGVRSITTAPSPVCTASSGTNRYIIFLENAENGNSSISDPLNTVTISQNPTGSPSQTVAGSLSNNQYVTGCLIANNFSLKTSLYSGTGNVPASGPGLDVTVHFGVNYNSVSSTKPTSASQEIGRAIAHTLDKPAFENSSTIIGGFADYIDIPLPGASGLVPCPPDVQPNCSNNRYPAPATGTPSKIPQAILDRDCSEHPWFTLNGGCHPFSLYNLRSDSVGAGALWWGLTGRNTGSDLGYAGPNDIQAACDHYVAAGFVVVGGTCADIANNSLGSTAPACASISAYTCPHLDASGHQVIIYSRTSKTRKAFMQIMADTINYMFGTPNNQGNNAVSPCVVNYGYLSPQGASHGCAPFYYTITQIFDVFFGITSFAGVPPGTGAIDDWNLGASGHSGGFPDALFGLGNSEFSGGVCGGVADPFPLNWMLFCDPSFDSDTSAGEFASSLSASDAFFSRASVTAAVTDVWSVPVYTSTNQFAALNAWNWQPGPQSSLVQVLGRGLQVGFNSLLNMRCNNAYTPSNSLYKCGGGISGLIRRGFSQDVHKLSPYQALTVWDFEVISQVYDSLLFQNPGTGLSGQLIDWMTKDHSSTINSVGNTVETWNLRNDLKFHDGVAVTADDVCFSILTDRDVPSSNLQPGVFGVISCKVVNPTTLTVTLSGISPFFELNIGGIPIVPAHLWSGPCSWTIMPGQHYDSITETPAVIAAEQASNCANPAFDPMAAGIYVGSGPWECKSSNGVIGGPCTSGGTQDVFGVCLGCVPQTISLTRYTGYDRCCPNFQGTSLQKLSWADKNNDGVVNILDIADAAIHYGQPSAYWDHQLFGVTDGVVDIGEIATIAFYYGHGVTSPEAPSALVALDPQVDPFEASAGGSTIVYQGLSNNVGKLAVKSGAPTASDFTMQVLGTSGNIVASATGQLDAEGRISFAFTGLTPSNSAVVNVMFKGGSLFSIQLIPGAPFAPLPPLVPTFTTLPTLLGSAKQSRSPPQQQAASLRTTTLGSSTISTRRL